MKSSFPANADRATVAESAGAAGSLVGTPREDSAPRRLKGNPFYAAIQERRAALAQIPAPAPRPPTLHERLIDGLIEDYEMIERHGFPPAFRNLFSDLAGYDDAGELEEMATQRRPDAFIIDRAQKTIILFEVVVNNPVSSRKAAAYKRVALACHDIGFGLFLVVVDRWGQETHFDLLDGLYRSLGWTVTGADGTVQGVRRAA